MEKIMIIEGMRCNHCSSRVEQALTKLGARADIDLNKKTAFISFDTPISDKALTDAVTNAGYEVISLKDK